MIRALTLALRPESGWCKMRERPDHPNRLIHARDMGTINLGRVVLGGLLAVLMEIFRDGDQEEADRD